MTGGTAATPDAVALERGRRLFTLPSRFLGGAASLRQIPESTLAEIAFAGRSNVGKSSLINALTGTKTLAKTSNTPGRTQQINFFDLGGRLVLADLPGYGYAAAPTAAVERWTRLVEAYLRRRVPLRRVLLLIDARHGVFAADRQVMALLDRAAVSYQLVLTKADKVVPSRLAGAVAQIEHGHAARGAAHPRVLVTSAAGKTGIAELRAALAELAEPQAPTPPVGVGEGSDLP
jgi:GTP-binding protein